MKNSKTKKLTTIGMLCTLAYIAVVVGRIPLVLFLKYDPKDVIIVIGGLIFGPLTSFAVTLIVSIVQMFTISGTGILGCSNDALELSDRSDLHGVSKRSYCRIDAPGIFAV